MLFRWLLGIARFKESRMMRRVNVRYTWIKTQQSRPSPAGYLAQTMHHYQSNDGHGHQQIPFLSNRLKRQPASKKSLRRIYPPCTTTTCTIPQPQSPKKINTSNNTQKETQVLHSAFLNNKRVIRKNLVVRVHPKSDSAGLLKVIASVSVCLCSCEN